NLNQSWEAIYYDPAKHEGPILNEAGSTTGGIIEVGTNAYDKTKEGPNNWYGSMSFGIESEEGFMGITWPPDPQKLYSITPKFAFYIAVGNFESNRLADINAISRTAQKVLLTDFDETLSCTVTYLADGGWSIRPGKPKTLTVHLLNGMVQSHLELTEAHNQLVKLLDNEITLNAPAFLNGVDTEVVLDKQ
ncbi:MAG: hypothetical protein AAFU67_18590, partial [Bacteroidota bacterium]